MIILRRTVFDFAVSPAVCQLLVAIAAFVFSCHQIAAFRESGMCVFLSTRRKYTNTIIFSESTLQAHQFAWREKPLPSIIHRSDPRASESVIEREQEHGMFHCRKFASLYVYMFTHAPFSFLQAIDLVDAPDRRENGRSSTQRTWVPRRSLQRCRRAAADEATYYLLRSRRRSSAFYCVFHLP